MTESSIIIVIHPGSRCALTASLITHMTLLTYILLVRFDYNLDVVFWIDSNRKDDITFIGHELMWFGSDNIPMASPTLAHAQTNYHVSQFDHRSQVITDTQHNWYTNYFSKIYLIKKHNLLIHYSCNAEAIIISLSEFDSNMVISLGCQVQG